MVERKNVSEFLSSPPQTTHSERDLITQHWNHENEDLEAVPSTRAENVRFTVAVENEGEDTSKCLKDN